MTPDKQKTIRNMLAKAATTSFTPNPRRGRSTARRLMVDAATALHDVIKADPSDALAHSALGHVLEGMRHEDPRGGADEAQVCLSLPGLGLTKSEFSKLMR